MEHKMTAISFTEVRNNLKTVFDDVVSSHEPCIVTRKNNEHVVVLSLEDYNSMSETNYLLSNPANKAHLLRSLEQARGGKTVKGELI
jgi:antitoxin YefM